MKPFLVFLFFFTSLFSREHRYDLAICTMFQNEAPYLKEWIEFHKLVGVQHFILFNDRSEDQYLEVLQPYLESGEVEVIDWFADPQKKWIPQQKKCFNEGLKRTRGICHWVAFIDVDEFLFPVQQGSLIDFLRGYERFGGVRINWQNYGTSNVDKIPEKSLLIETLVRKLPTTHAKNHACKSVVQPERVRNSGSIHVFEYKKPYYDVFPNKSTNPYTIDVSQVRINHYWTRDEMYFRKVKLARHEKCERQRMRIGESDFQKIQVYYEELNAVEDLSALRFAPALRRILFG